MLQGPVVQAEQPVDFNHDVRPILSDNCFSCHGFDEASREADLRLDTREGATADLGGYAAIVAGAPDESELMLRVSSDDDDLVMPPSDSHKPRLEAKQIELLRRWIDAGAPWGRHWAFVPPVRPSVVDDDAVAVESRKRQHPIDILVRRQLEREGIRASARAKPHVLARRLSFDLTGLPPSMAQVQQLGDASPESTNDYIDSLLDSKHYGERMAMWWLDGARYCDTDGYQADATRTNWPWRDWVIDAFNTNKPFDEFTLEQFAGDLLPEASPEQRLATCFHRNHMHNGEGGRDPEESRVDYVLDRVNTVGTLWLGLTLGCAQCHDHKFDPISQADYYQLNAYFNSIDETGAAGAKAGPFLKYRSKYAAANLEEAEQVAAQSDQRLAQVTDRAKQEFGPWLKAQIAKLDAFQAWHPLSPDSVASVEGYPLHVEDDQVISGPARYPQDDFVVTFDELPVDRLTAVRLEVLADHKHTDGKYSHAPSGEFILTNVKLRVRRTDSSQYRDLELRQAIASTEGQGSDSKYGRISGTLDDDPRTGWTTRTKPVKETQTALFELETPLGLGTNEVLEVILMQRSLAPRELIGRFRLSATNQRGPAVESLNPMPLQLLASWLEQRQATESTFDADEVLEGLDGQLKVDLLSQFLTDHPTWQAAKRRNQTIHRQLDAARKATNEVLVTVLKERDEPRSTHILQRGVWDQKGRAVERNVITVIAPTENDVPTRLELAEWIVDVQNPLTARVITNQVWQLFFGSGLVRTPNDFGQQGELPTHPELLDWLAVEFIESGWDLKHLVRTIVSSETYQQSSLMTLEQRERDPENRLLARGARFRLPSWMIRDAALATSGLLNSRLGGPPMFPYQPEGVWRDQFMGRFTYQPTLGVGQYRRTVYAFWRRTSTPTFLFDAANRRNCEVTLRRTNTPLQALTLMNDLTSLEAARALADRVVNAPVVGAQDVTQLDAPGKTADPLALDRCLSELYRHVLCRLPTPQELDILRRTYQQASQRFRTAPEQAIELTSIGQRPVVKEHDAEHLASMMLLANLVLNLDEAMTHE